MGETAKVIRTSDDNGVEQHVLTEIPFSFDEEAFREKIRFDAYPELEEELARYLERARAVVNPKGLVRTAYVGARDGVRLHVADATFESEILVENLEGINRVFAYTATCGAELYNLDISDLDPFASFWHDSFKIGAIEAAANYTCDYVRRTYEIEKLSSMNPGSGDADVWPISQQVELFKILGDTEQIVGVRLTDSFLMVPDKTVSGIYFASDREYVNCSSCTRKICPNRRAPYRVRA